MNSMRLGTKLILSFSCLMLIAALLGLTSYYAATQNAATIRLLTGAQLPGVQAILTLTTEINAIDSARQSIADLEGDSSVRLRRYEEFAAAQARFDAAWKTYAALLKTAEEVAMGNELQAAYRTLQDGNEAFLRVARQIDALKVGGPLTLDRDLVRFRGDHYSLENQVLMMCQSKEVFAGGDDPASCNFGRWKMTCKIANPRIVALLQEIEQSHQRFHAGVKRAKEAVKAGNIAEARSAYAAEVEPNAGQTRARFDLMLKVSAEATALAGTLRGRVQEEWETAEQRLKIALSKLVKQEGDETALVVARANASSALFQKLSLAAMLLGVAAGLALAWVLTRSITKPIRGISENLAAGAQQTAAAATQVSAASQTLSAGASQQAASLEETSSSLEEMSGMTKRNADHAQRANGLAREAREAAESGVADMQAMNAAMTDIKASGDGIAKIIKTIDEIAFQTNILALNAAVEAARAGEAGMGFAVVADEVRNLAQRSAVAAKETAEKIQNAIDKTAHGVGLCAKVGQTLHEIAAKARQVDELVAEVATASREQTCGIDQLNAAVGQIDQVTQANAAGAEESASAAEELNAQAESLKDAVQQLLALVNGRTVTAALPDAGTPKQEVNGKPVAPLNSANASPRPPEDDGKRWFRNDRARPAGLPSAGNFASATR